MSCTVLCLGSGAFKVFQPAVVDKVLGCFKLTRLLEGKHQSTGAGGGSKRKASKAAAGHAKRKRGIQRRAMDEQDLDDNNEDLLVNTVACYFCCNCFAKII